MIAFPFHQRKADRPFGRFVRKAGVVATTVVALSAGVAPVVSNAQSANPIVASQVTSAPAPAPAAALPGEVLHWGLDEVTGTVAADSIGAFPGTYAATATRGEASFGSGHGTAVKGQVSRAIPTSVTAGGPVSLEFWAKGTTATGYYARIGDLKLERIAICCNGVQLARIWSGGSWTEWNLGSNGVNIDLPVWHHYVLTNKALQL
jgi:hypothetical protein